MRLALAAAAGLPLAVAAAAGVTSAPVAALLSLAIAGGIAWLLRARFPPTPAPSPAARERVQTTRPRDGDDRSDAAAGEWDQRHVSRRIEPSPARGGGAGWGPRAARTGAIIAGVVLAALFSARMPLSVDGEVYLYQARLLADGTLATGPLPDGFFHYDFLIPQDGGALAGAFPPGWPAVLALGVLAGVPWLVNPLLAGLLVWLVMRLAREVAPDRPGAEILAGWLAAASPFTVALGGSFMSHPLAACLTVAALWAALAARRSMPAAVAAGVLIGALVCTRPLDGVVAALVVVAVALARRTPVARLGAGAVAAIAIGALYPAVNAAVSGDPFTAGQSAWFAISEPNPDCHRLGFGDDIGCVLAHRLEAPGFGPADALRVTGERLADLGRFGLGPGLALLLPLVLVRRPRPRAWWPPALLAATLVGAYALFYFHGNYFGPRLYAGAFAVLLPLVAVGAIRLGWIGIAVAVAGLIPGHLLMRDEVASYRTLPRAAIADRIAAAGERGPAIVFVSSDRLRADAMWIHYGPALAAAGPPSEHARVIAAHDLGPANPRLARRFPGRTAYRLSLAPGQAPRLEPLALDPVGAIVMPLAASYPLADRPPCAFAWPVDTDAGRALRIAARQPCAIPLARSPEPGEAILGAAVTGTWTAVAGDRTVPLTTGPLRAHVLGPVAPGTPIVLRGTGTIDARELVFRPR